MRGRNLRNRRNLRQRRNRRGGSVVEAAICLPLLVGLVFGCVDFGRFAYTYIAVTNAARAGAATGSVRSFTPDNYTDWEQAVRQAVVAEMEGVPGFDESQLQFEPPTLFVDPGQPRRFRLAISYPFQTLVNWPLVPTHATMRRALEMPFIR
jgi:Flp pilus assembly protein TadG